MSISKQGALAPIGSPKVDSFTGEVITFKAFEKACLKAAWYYAKLNRDIPLEELKAQTALLFCEALAGYNPAGGGFHTYLTDRLRKLSHYVIKWRRHIKAETGTDPVLGAEIDLVAGRDRTDPIQAHHDPAVDSLLREGKRGLSASAYEVYEWCLLYGDKLRHPVSGYKRRPSAQAAAEYFCRDCEGDWAEITAFVRESYNV